MFRLSTSISSSSSAIGSDGSTDSACCGRTPFGLITRWSPSGSAGLCGTALPHALLGDAAGDHGGGLALGLRPLQDLGHRLPEAGHVLERAGAAVTAGAGLVVDVDQAAG